MFLRCRRKTSFAVLTSDLCVPDIPLLSYARPILGWEREVGLAHVSGGGRGGSGRKTDCRRREGRRCGWRGGSIGCGPGQPCDLSDPLFALVWLRWLPGRCARKFCRSANISLLSRTAARTALETGSTSASAALLLIHELLTSPPAQRRCSPPEHPRPLWKSRHSVRGADARGAQLACQPRTKPLRIECEPLTCGIGKRTSTIGPAVQKARIDGGGPSRSHARPPQSTTPRADAARKCKPSSQPARRHCEHARLELSTLCAHFVLQAPPRHADDATRPRRPCHTCTYIHTRDLSECPQRASYSSSSPHGPIPHISA